MLLGDETQAARGRADGVVRDVELQSGKRGPVRLDVSEPEGDAASNGRVDLFRRDRLRRIGGGAWIRPATSLAVLPRLLGQGVMGGVAVCHAHHLPRAEGDEDGGVAQPDLAEQGLHPRKESPARSSLRIGPAVVRPSVTGSPRHHVPPLFPTRTRDLQAPKPANLEPILRIRQDLAMGSPGIRIQASIAGALLARYPEGAGWRQRDPAPMQGRKAILAKHLWTPSRRTNGSRCYRKGGLVE